MAPNCQMLINYAKAYFVNFQITVHIAVQYLNCPVTQQLSNLETAFSNAFENHQFELVRGLTSSLFDHFGRLTSNSTTPAFVERLFKHLQKNIVFIGTDLLDALRFSCDLNCTFHDPFVLAQAQSIAHFDFLSLEDLPPAYEPPPHQ